MSSIETTITEPRQQHVAVGLTKDRRPSRTYALVFVVVLLCEVGIVVGGNVIVDPRGEFPSHFFRPIVATDFDEKATLYAPGPDGYDTVVIGSSRSMMLSPQIIEEAGGGRTFNFAISNLHPQDATAILRLMVTEGELPREIIYGLELDQLQPQGISPWRLRSSPSHSDLWDRHPGITDYVSRLPATFTVSYSLSSLRSLRFAIQGFPEAEFTFDADSTVHYPALDRRVADGSFNATAVIASDIEVLAPILEAYVAPDPLAVDDLLQFVEAATSQGIRVRFFFTPLAPALPERLGPTFTAVEEEAITTAVALCSPLVNVQDMRAVSSFDGDPQLFYDARHYMAPNAALLADALYAERSARCGL